MTEPTVLRRALEDLDGLDFVVLIGSRARGDAHEQSDWDLAVQWSDAPDDALDAFARDESLRRRIAAALGTHDDRVDIVNLERAGLAMRAVVAGEGIPVVGEDRPPWAWFLTRTWRELEFWEWEREHAA
ncbi:nucleotidyltransferase domain-containing protein [Thioalkalivibrio sp. ALE20]|uniref:type VII toxin-antitoxin system MntA family adenylyltransferase antitoxin n=1 Tax=Thioalkalivibrio sp. ALE20 TaxID=545275 RepID=UPI00035D387A|nr:nucleotidyltransferase domain-containing protein [Thioalkalivibrio sp. ALE20]